ncbi:fimbrial protein [Lelliottia wanjuensis]|uniref:fimbrial protein n=1 Tax=Lelliottia wanjuensis TaxID=3050585 RepID=UPI00254A3507|nr:fimbrial protein [Lelliottia sp. V86_10]MDK9586399.1 fimbrial protein [Lelliottia sp. V86_10]
MRVFSVIFLRFLFGAILLIGSIDNVWASEGPCYPSPSTHQFHYNFGTYAISDINYNHPGVFIQNVYHWHSGDNYQGYCDCTGNSMTDVKYKTITSLANGHTSGFYKLNEYLEFSMDILLVNGDSQNFVPIPWNNVANHWIEPCYVAHSVHQWTTGSEGKLSLYIAKAFIGETVIIDEKLVDIYATRVSGNYGNTPMASVYMAGIITAPQKCVINAGQMVTVNFGNIPAANFTTKTQAPTGYSPKTISTAIKCTNVDAYANLTVRFQADASPDYASAIKTNNPDIGVIMMDTNGKLTLPNSGLIPFHLDGNAEATVTFKATPVSTTGKIPGLGKFTAQAYIRVDYA